MIMATHPLPSSCFFARRVKKGAVDVVLCCACESWVKLFVVFVLAVVLYDFNVIRAVFSVDDELF